MAQEEAMAASLCRHSCVEVFTSFHDGHFSTVSHLYCCSQQDRWTHWPWRRRRAKSSSAAVCIFSALRSAFPRTPQTAPILCFAECRHRRVNKVNSFGKLLQECDDLALALTCSSCRRRSATSLHAIPLSIGKARLYTAWLICLCRKGDPMCAAHRHMFASHPLPFSPFLQAVEKRQLFIGRNEAAFRALTSFRSLFLSIFTFPP